jgi:radical SAM superfamily enzyme YgiQ (UPF0313 family)
MRILLLNTYDLGRQPFGLASPAAWLKREGFEVECLDLAVQPLDVEAVRRADLIAFHLPMHTATRLAERVIRACREAHPRARLCAYGLYAPMNEAWLRGLGVETVVGGEFEPSLVSLASRLAGGETPRAGEPPEPRIGLDRLTFIPPDRSTLPPLERYARLVGADGVARVVGTTEASRGCKHACRHCPVVPVYGGRFRIVQREVVLEDIRRQAAAGARHITFGDPDFFNGIGHAIPIVRELHAEHPQLTYDVTIKIEHLLRHAEHMATLRETGCAFVTSAVESIDDRVLAILDKGHTRADFLEVVSRFRSAGLHLNPTFVAFNPWTTLEGYRELLAVLAEWGLEQAVQPVQLAIRLLVPAGSRLLELEELRRQVGPFDEATLVHPWRHRDPRVDGLQKRLVELVAEAGARGASRRSIFEQAWRLSADSLGAPPELAAFADRPARAPIPYLTEPWYC